MPQLPVSLPHSDVSAQPCLRIASLPTAGFARLHRGRKAGADYLGVRWLASPSAGSTALPRTVTLSLGIIINKKVSKRAVQRNRVRRRIREALRMLSRGQLLLCNYDLLVIAYPNANEASYWQLQASLEHALRRSHFPWYEGYESSPKREGSSPSLPKYHAS